MQKINNYDKLSTTFIYYYLIVFYLVFDLHPFIHTQFDLYPPSAHELSTVSVPITLFTVITV